jgi:hypothetical protein
LAVGGWRLAVGGWRFKESFDFTEARQVVFNFFISPGI